LFGASPITPALDDDDETSSTATIDTAFVLQDVENADTFRTLRMAPHEGGKGARLVADELRDFVSFPAGRTTLIGRQVSASSLSSAICKTHDCSAVTLDSVTLDGDDLTMVVTISIKAADGDDVGVFVNERDVRVSEESIRAAVEEAIAARYALFFDVESVTMGARPPARYSLARHVGAVHGRRRHRLHRGGGVDARLLPSRAARAHDRCAHARAHHRGDAQGIQ